MKSKRMEEHLALLEIRRKAGQRDLVIISGIFIIAFLLSLAFGLLDQLSGRSVYVVGSLVFVFCIVTVMAWVRLQIINESIDLIHLLQDSK